MINMAVISLKDIVKYFIKITLVLTITIGTIKYFSNVQNSVKQSSIPVANLLLSCLDTAIPGIASINNSQESADENAKLEPLKLALETQLKMFSSLESNAVLAENNLQDSNKQGATNATSNSSLPNSQNNTQEDQDNVEQAKTGLKTEVQNSNVTSKYTVQYEGVKIKNETDYKLTKEILTPNIKVNSKNIIIFHTHACESYTSSDKYKYTPTGNFRTTDKNYSVVKVGKELTAQLKSYKYNVIHNETLHEYPSYTGSYTNSLKTVTKLLEENKNTDIAIDLHRDAVGDNTYAPTVKIGDEYAAQLMFVIGGNGSKIKHEDWQQNLKFAIKIQKKANELYPGLFKPIILRYSGYNQHLSKAAVIIEVGATGNTLDQALNSMKYLAKVMDEALNTK